MEGKATKCKIKGLILTCLTKIDFLLWTFLQTLQENSIDFNVKFRTIGAFNPILPIQTNQIDMFNTCIMNNTSGESAKHMINMEKKNYSTTRRISYKIEQCMFYKLLGNVCRFFHDSDSFFIHTGFPFIFS